MAPTCKIPLPAGSLKVAFKGTIPKVSGVQSASPVYGIMKVGYTFRELILSDGTVYEGLDTTGLVSALNEHAEDEARYIKMEMTLPNESKVVLQAGDHGLIIEDKWGKAILTGVAQDSPLKKDLRVGMIVDSVTFADGYCISGHSADEINDALAASSEESERTLVLKSPSSVLSSRSAKLAAGKSVPIPQGTTEELGLTIVGSRAASISSIAEESPVAGMFRVGYSIESITDAAGHSFEGLNGQSLSKVIDATAASTDRVLKLMTDTNVTGNATIKITDPIAAGTSLRDLGLGVFGAPATISSVEETSPLAGMVFPGFSITKFGWSDGTEFENLDEKDLSEVIADSDGIDGRYMVLQNFVEKSTDVVECILPAGKLGLTFKGTPPVVTKVKDTSALAGIVEEGMVADTLTTGTGTKYYQMTTKSLTGSLASTATDGNRKLRFIKLDGKAQLSVKPVVGIKPEMTVVLPQGKLGVTFKGSSAPCKVHKIKDESPLITQVGIGMAVDYVTVNGRDYPSLNATELADLLKATADVPGRTMKVRDPARVNEFTKVPDVLEITLPTGKLGCTFTQKPPIAKSFKENSPIAASFPPGMFVDKLIMADGYSVSGMNTRELATILGKYSSVEGRCLLLKNSKTQTPSPRAIECPEEMTVTIPTGKLGISFRGSKIARVTRLHDGTKMLGKAYESMLVDTISIPGGSSFSHMTAKEVARILKDTKNVGGRTITFKKADSTNLSVRNIATDDASIGASSQDMSAAFSTSTSGSLSSVRM